MALKQRLDRLVYARPGKLHNFLIHPFLLQTASYGIALVFFSHTAPVQMSILYTLTVVNLSSAVISGWGLAAVLISLAVTVAMVVRKRWLGRAVGMAGFMLWLYAAIMYGFFGFWLQFFFAAIPNMMFWGWTYYNVGKYHDFYDELDHSN